MNTAQARSTFGSRITVSMCRAVAGSLRGSRRISRKQSHAMKRWAILLTALLLAPLACAAGTVATAPQWQEVELTFTAAREAANPYTDTEAWADFTHEDGTKIRRPMFWEGGRTFCVRFASTKSSGT